MDVFTVGLITLLVCTAIFFVVLFSFIYYWHLRKITYVVVPVIWTFEFFVICFFIVALVSIILNYLPYLVKVGGII
jgi:uncharacterized membrane protein (DUF106 family)